MTANEQYASTTEQLKIEVIREIAHLSGDPHDALAACRNKLETLHGQMAQRGDDTTSLIEAWHNIESLYLGTGKAIDLAAGSRAIAQDLQRKLASTTLALDVERHNHTELETAIRLMDENHPTVEDTLNNMRGRVIEEYAESDAFISYCPACEMIDGGLIGLDHNVAKDFHEFLFDTEDLDADEIEELEEFIANFVDRVKSRINGTPLQRQ